LKNTKRPCKVLRIKDGDTIEVAFLLEPDRCFPRAYKSSIRIVGIDAFELKSKIPEEKAKAEQGKNLLENLILGKKVVIHFSGRDKFGRLLGSVFYGMYNIGDLLLEKGLAKVYFGGKRS